MAIANYTTSYSRPGLMGFGYNETKEQLFISVIFDNENMKIHKWKKKKAEAPEVMDKLWYNAVVPVLKNFRSTF